MGAKLSSCFNHRGSLSQQQAASPAPVRIIAADGSLKELPAGHRVSVSDVLGSGDTASSFFLCSSNALYFDQSPPALASGELLQPGQIYFVLPAAALGRPLSSADMAALAVRASAALAAKRPQRRHGGKKKLLKVRVVPVHEELVTGGEDGLFNEKLNELTLGEFAAGSLIPAKGHEKLAAARSRLKRALSIIQEDAE
ncbi:uncharacterized protein LOC100826767 [Brachypodium distachyon]|uniref:Uncharacterized protein n=1 Tax=Brachypodium distachyon TaxID=15368 RepID=I1HY85_BRADI|nr:uncharacterized protein LOC100826767 [Brachypodium distachyon]KQJ93798.1 hypothetical protein BRADI_3g06790v3 [Brachypodium distachyon]|eukprot:XP_003571146.1 uncharacterized protein LOC100826767 [Brachypodium distachyon]